MIDIAVVINLGLHYNQCTKMNHVCFAEPWDVVNHNNIFSAILSLFYNMFSLVPYPTMLSTTI